MQFVYEISFDISTRVFLFRVFHGSCCKLEGLARQVRKFAAFLTQVLLIGRLLAHTMGDTTCSFTLQDGVQQHLLQSRDGHGQRGVGALQSSSF